MAASERVINDVAKSEDKVSKIGAIDRLPPPNTKRWVVRRKAEVIAAIRDGVLTRDDACTRYQLSDEELKLWERAIDAAGVPGLRVTRVQIYREVFEKRN